MIRCVVFVNRAPPIWVPVAYGEDTAFDIWGVPGGNGAAGAEHHSRPLTADILLERQTRPYPHEENPNKLRSPSTNSKLKIWECHEISISESLRIPFSFPADMVGSGGSSSSRIRDEERFYCPPALRKQRELQKQRELLLQQKNEPAPSTRSSSPAADVRVAEDRLGTDDALSKPSVSSSSSPSISPSPTPTPSPPLPPSPAGNLDRLLESTTPVVPARYFSKVWK